MRAALVLSMCALLSACGAREARYTPPDDNGLKAAVQSQLASEGPLSPLSGVEVSATGGVVTLSGLVDSVENAAKAESLTRSVPQVERVINNLQVIPAAVLLQQRAAAAGDPRGAPR